MMMNREEDTKKLKMMCQVSVLVDYFIKMI